MNAFGEALNLVFMRWSGDFSSGSMPMEWISDCIPMSSSSYLPANEFKTQTAFPWVRVPLPMNLRLHSHESLSYSCESQTAFPWVRVPISLPMNLRMHSHEFEFLFPCQILESFGWVPSMSCHPDSGMPLESPQLRPERDFGGTPYNHTWVPLKSIVEHFRALLRDFCFSLGFMRISDSSMHDVQYLCGFSKSPVDDLLLGWSPSWEVVDGTPDSGMPLGFHQMRPERDFGGTPYNHTWVPIKSIWERFRCLLRDFCFWANFSIFRIEKILIFDAEARIKENEAIGPQSNRLKWSSRVVLEWQK